VSVSLCEAEGLSSALRLELIRNLGRRLQLELVTFISSSKLNIVMQKVNAIEFEP